MANKTIQELDAIELADNDLLPVWDTSDGRTKKSAISDMKQKIVGTVDNAATPESNNLITSGAVAAACSYCASDNTTVTGPALFNGAVVKIMFTSAITGSDTTTPLAINYNGTSYNVKATSNGSLKNFTATPIETETREQTRGKSEEESETKGGEGTRATTTTYVYCQAYTTLELLFDGTQFVIIGNPVVISNADYTIYTDGTSKYNVNAVDSRIANLKYLATNLGQSTGYVKLSNVSLSLYHSNSYLIKFRLYAFLINITRLSNGYEYGARNIGIASSAVKAYYDNAGDVYVLLPAFASGVSVITMDNTKNDFSISILTSLPSEVTIAEIPIV